MKCEKCGFLNSKFDIICNECGAPLNVTLNYDPNNKPRAIDIEEIEIDNTEFHFNQVKKLAKILIIICLAIVFLFSFKFTSWIFKEIRNSNILVQIDDFKEEKRNGIIYIGKDEKLSKKLKEYSVNYEFEYMYITSENITKIKKKKIIENLKLDKLNSTIIYIENGKVKDYIHGITIDNYEDNLDFFKEKNIISQVIGNPKKIIEEYDEAFNLKEPIIIYIANNKHDLSKKNNSKISSFCKEYSINYLFVEGYKLNEKQKLRLLNKLNYSDIHDELIVFLDEGEVKEVSEFIPKDESEYFDKASNYGIIDSSSAESLVTIDFNKFKSIVSEQNKNVIVIGSNDCKYCEQLKPIIGKIGIQNNLKIYYVEFKEEDFNIINEYFKSIGYNGIISYPLVIVSENNQVLDRVIGLSNKDIYLKKFKEMGVIQ